MTSLNLSQATVLLLALLVAFGGKRPSFLADAFARDSLACWRGLKTSFKSIDGEEVRLVSPSDR